MENELALEKLVNTSIIFNVKFTTDNLCSDISKKDIAKSYIDEIKNNDYDIIYFASSFGLSSEFDSYSLVAEVFLQPKHILKYLKFEKELQNKGYDVHFSRSGTFYNL